MKFFKLTYFVFLLLFAVSLSNGEVAVKQKAGELKTTVTCKYLLYLPEGYGQKGKKWPLMVFLHGAGERGDNLELLKLHGPPKLIEQGKKFDFIIVSPQCPAHQWWPAKADVLIALFDEIESKYDVDKDRVYLTGLSMGGFASWTLGCGYPERFAAIAPICGGGEKLLAPAMKSLPIWAFHGAKDPIVPLARSQEMVDAVNAAGGNAKLTVYPNAEHDSWTQTYDDPALYEWFLSHRISDRKK
jgi:predicted peptidase